MEVYQIIREKSWEQNQNNSLSLLIFHPHLSLNFILKTN